LYAFESFKYVGIEVWQVKSGSVFGNFLLTDEPSVAKKAATEILKRVAGEKAAEKAEQEAAAAATAAASDDSDDKDNEEDDENKEKEEEKEKKSHTKKLSSVLKLRSSSPKEKREKFEKGEKEEKNKLLVMIKKVPRKRNSVKDPRAKELSLLHKKGSIFFIAGSSPDTPWKKCTANFKEKVITITKNKKEEIEINITQLSQPLKISDIGEAPNGSTTMYFINVFL